MPLLLLLAGSTKLQLKGLGKWPYSQKTLQPLQTVPQLNVMLHTGALGVLVPQALQVTLVLHQLIHPVLQVV